jgi:hypothetical protein
MLASQRTSDNPKVDLVRRGGREMRRQRDLNASLGAALAELSSPFSATEQRKGHTEKPSPPPITIVTTTAPPPFFSPPRQPHDDHDDDRRLCVRFNPTPHASCTPTFLPSLSPFNLKTTRVLPRQQQPLFSPAPFYVYPQRQPAAMPAADKHTSPGNPHMKMAAIPPVLVPGGVDREHVPGAFS